MRSRSTAEHRRLEEARRPRATGSGAAGGRTCPSASGAPCARTTRPTARPGTTFPFDHARLARVPLGRRRPARPLRQPRPRRASASRSGTAPIPILKERLFGVSGNGGQPRRGREGALLVPRRDADLQLRACALQVPADGVPLRRAPRALAGGEQGTTPSRRCSTPAAFDDDRYFDVRRRVREGRRRTTSSCASRCTTAGPSAAPLVVLPQLWFRNTWSWAHGAPRPGDARARGASRRRARRRDGRGAPGALLAPRRRAPTSCSSPRTSRTRGASGACRTPAPYVKDAFHEAIVHGRRDAVNPARRGTKVGARFSLHARAGAEPRRVRLRYADRAQVRRAFADFDAIFEQRIARGRRVLRRDRAAVALGADEKRVFRAVDRGPALEQAVLRVRGGALAARRPGAPGAAARRGGRGATTRGGTSTTGSALDARQVGVPLVRGVGPRVPLHPAGAGRPGVRQAAAHAARARVVHAPERADPGLRVAARRREPAGARVGGVPRLPDRAAHDRARATARSSRAIFLKLMLNFTWWVNRKDTSGRNVFEGGFLGLDNIGLFDRSKPLPGRRRRSSRPTRRAGWACTASTCSTSRSSSRARTPATRTSRTSSSSTSCSSRTRPTTSPGEDVRPLGREGRLLLRRHAPPVGGELPGARALDGGPHAALRRVDARTATRSTRFPRVLAARAVVSAEPAGARRALPADGRARAGASGGCCRSSTREQARARAVAHARRRRSSCRPTGCARSRARTPTHPYELVHRRAVLPGRLRAGRVPNGPLRRATRTGAGPVWMPVNYLVIESLQRLHHYYGDSLQRGVPDGLGEAP